MKNNILSIRIESTKLKNIKLQELETKETLRLWRRQRYLTNKKSIRLRKSSLLAMKKRDREMLFKELANATWRKVMKDLFLFLFQLWRYNISS